VLLGMDNPIDGTVYARKDGDPRIVLLSSAVKTAVEKKLFDFRQKDVFRFETKDVQMIELRAKDQSWTARRRTRAGSGNAPPRPGKDMKINGCSTPSPGSRPRSSPPRTKSPRT